MCEIHSPSQRPPKPRVPQALVPSPRRSKPPRPSRQTHQHKQGEEDDFSASRDRRKPTDPSVHCAWVKVGLGSQSLVCNSLLQHRHPHFIVFFFWPLTMISRTWERSIILVSISMMSGCSLAPLMNSSSVNSPDDTKQKKKKRIKMGLQQPNLQQEKAWGRSGALYLLHWHLSCRI